MFEEDSMEESTFIQHQTVNPAPPLQLPALPLSATTSEYSTMRPTLSPTTSPNPTPSALSLADSLVTAVKNLQTELATVQAKLIAAEQQLKEMPSESMFEWEYRWEWIVVRVGNVTVVIGGVLNIGCWYGGVWVHVC